MKILNKLIIIIILIIALIYTTNISGISNNIIIFKGERLKLDTVVGLVLNVENSYKTVKTSSNLSNTETAEVSNGKLKLFNVFNVKDIKITEIPTTTVVPLGNVIGLKLYTSGVMIIGMTEIEGEKPYLESNLEEGDLIVKINDKEINSTGDLVNCVNNSNGERLEIDYIRNGKEQSTNIEPVKAEEEYKLGLWVRDGAAGIGTITYYEPESNKFAALGHGITDADTDKLITISSGEIVTTTVSSIVKGTEGKPGEIRGTIINQTDLGKISHNSEFGIYGTIENETLLNINRENSIEVAMRNEIEEGKAQVILTLENGVRKEYDIEITKIYINNNSDNKSMKIKIIDEELLNLTGGIIQGMSGAPIVQNGKFIRSSNPCTSSKTNRADMQYLEI